MTRRSLLSLLGAVAMLLSGLAALAPAANAAAGGASGLHAHRACHANLARGAANCHALLLVKKDGSYAASPPRRPPH